LFCSKHCYSRDGLKLNMITLIQNDGELLLDAHFIGPDEASRLYARLLDDLHWQEEKILVYGKPVVVPRLVCWYGDPEAVYTYSGVLHTPLPWTPILTDLKLRIEAISKRQFNSVLANLYRSGNDSMGWHADKEKELGQNPFIASISLGEKRVFKVRHNKTKQTVDIELPNGSLLLMGGSFQHHWRHCVPKTKQLKQGRINLTFRQVLH
jgi:alkylated DNA repair dioxygenase AlkB